MKPANGVPGAATVTHEEHAEVPDFCAAQSCEGPCVVPAKSVTDQCTSVWDLAAVPNFASTAPIGVVVVGGKTRIARILEEVIRAAPAEFYACGFAADAAAARRLFEIIKPGIALVELALPDGCGLRAAAELAAIQPGLRLILVSSLVHERVVQCAFTSWADSVLVPPVKFRQCLCSLRLVAYGLRNRTDPRLTINELQVLSRFAGGLTNKEIVSELGVTLAHLRKIDARIRRYFSARNRTEAVSQWLLQERRAPPQCETDVKVRSGFSRRGSDYDK